MDINREDTAIVFIDPQNDVLSEKGLAWPLVRESLKKTIRLRTWSESSRPRKRNMIVRLLADKMDFENGRPKPTYKHKLLAMIDEFPALGKLEILQESLAFVAGYGIKCYLISQDINQLKSRETGYGPDETITSNCHVQTAFPPNRLETAEHLSKLTGQTTIIKSRSHVSAADLGLTFQRRCKRCNGPLLTPDEDARTEERHPGPHH